MKRILTVLCIVFCVNCFAVTVCADVSSTKDPTAGNDIYIAGNPDLYPVEYYNTETECYEGILPEIYKRISDNTGISFSYIGAGKENRQKELCKNNQVEIVSAYIQGKVSAAEETTLFTYTEKGKDYTVCIGFTDIAKKETVSAVKNALEQVSKEEWLSASMHLAENGQSSLSIYVYIILAILIIALSVLIIYTVKKNGEKKKSDQSKMTDEVTGIGNLDYFKDCYCHHISEEMQNLYYLSYVAVDVQKLETYFGGEESEEIQRFAAGILTNNSGDNDFAARIENGVFAVCFMAPDSERAVKAMTDTVDALNGYNESFAKENKIVFRAGVYPLGKRQTTVETAIFNARQGYNHAAKENELVCLCDNTVLGKAALKSRLQQKLSNAIDNGEFALYLQFVVDTKTERICGAEVLSRWHSPEEGVLTPSNYIEDMKTAGLIDKLDFFVFEKVCQILESWRDTDYGNLYLSCNFTRVTVSSSGFLDAFRKIISRYSFDRKNIVIELTEDSLANNGTVAYKNVIALKDMGCRIALDDLGSGYTSFSDLCDYPVDIIKIDRHIVAKSVDARGGAVLKGIIKMAHELGISVLCEGVETDIEDSNVKKAKCDYIQGFLYSRVLPKDNAMEFYDKKQKL